MDVSDDDTVSGNKLVLRPLIGLMNGLEPQEIEQFVIEELEKHRRLRDEAIRLETILESQPSGAGVDTNRAFISAMIAVHAQQTVVSTLLDILGYIPETLTKKPH
ncbi:MAG TPA: transcriptional repressor TraM [Shinella sp.]|uniref:transcriptional repressor TraM n=1 Tax=Shinella TaxID=323620 RepID=UPI0011AB7AF0|nr:MULTISPECIES: transcriptional repressor TraM [Shinella]MDC7260318.1 transcriptional repressor TraM [Shinella sp. YE25]HEV7248098.1 transcriptional repressor TraM [Shinella sp.]